MLLTVHMQAVAVHSAPPPEPDQGDDVEAMTSAGKVLVPDGEHAMFNKFCCGSFCGSNTQVKDDEQEHKEEAYTAAVPEAQAPEEPVPEARDMEKEGFFPPDALDDVIDRINEVVGIWGISEEVEREYIKAPCEALNRLVAAAMATFMNNPLMDLISFLMDETMDFGVKVAKIAQYLKEQFVDPLCDALVNGLEETFSCISWIKNQVRKVIMMMSQMVTDEVVSKTVEQVGDSDLVD